MKISNEFKIGLASIAAIVILVVGIQYLKGINLLRQGQYFYVRCPQAGGLAVSGHVTLNGMEVGLVRDLTYNPEGHVDVLINIDSDLRVPADSRAEVATDLLGTASVVLHLGTSSELLQPYDTLHGGGRAPSMLDAAGPTLAAVGGLMPKLDTLIAGLNVLVGESRVHESLLAINTLTTQLQTTVGQLNRLLSNDVPQLLATANDAAASIDTIATQVREADVEHLLADVAVTLNRANALLADVQSQSSTVGKLTTTTELHDQLTTTLASVDSLVADIRENPKRYINIKVFGK